MTDGTPTAAASSRLWPPTLTRLPPTEGDVGRRQEDLEFAHGVAEEDRGLGGTGGLGAAAGQGHALPSDQGGDPLEAVRVSGHQHQ